MRRLCLGVLTFMWAMTADAEDEPLTLTEAVEHAALASPDVAMRNAAAEAAQALVVPAGQLPDPELVVGIDNLPITGPDAGSASADFMTMRKVGVMQTFTRQSKRDLRSRRADDAVGVTRAEQKEAELDVKRQAAQAWIATYIAEDTVRRLQSLEPEFELQARVATSAVSSGRLSSADALAAESALFEFRDRIRAAEQAVHRSRAELDRWLPTEANRSLASAPAFDALSTPAPQLLSTVHHHASLLTYEAQLDAARTDIALAQAEKRPDWRVELDYAKRGAAFSDMVSLEFRVGLPLFGSRRQDPVIAEKHALLRKVEAEREAELRMHTAEVSQQASDWEMLKTRVASYEQELVPLAHARSQAALAAFQSAQTTIKPVLDARAAEVDTQLRALELKGQLGNAWAYLSYLQTSRSLP